MKRLFLPILFIICLHLQVQKSDGDLQLYPLRYFVDTDNFGKEYLEDLENSLEKIKIDTIRFMAMNDLGCHYHTRNLQKSLEIINQGLEEVRSAENVLWEGRMQVLEGAILLRMEELDHAELVLRSTLQKIPEAETWLLQQP